MYTRAMRPHRNTGKPYIPKRKKIELDIQIRACSYTRKNYPHVIFHSDYAAGLDLTKHQARVNSSIQSEDKFPDWTCFEPSKRINPKTGVPYVGLALELKKDGTTVILKIGPDKGKLTKDEHIRAQAATLRKLNNAGWYANFCIGYDQFIKTLDWYFDNEQTSLF